MAILPQSHTLLSPEDRVLVLSCRKEPPLSWLKSALSSQPDWRRLVDKARYHRMTALVYHALSVADSLDRLPGSLRDQLQRYALEMGELRTAQRRTLEECASSFKTADLDFMVLKGPMLQSLYPNGVPRASHDIDLIVREEDVQKVWRTMRETGYTLVTRVPPGLRPKEAVAFAQYFEQFRFQKPDRTEVEIHFRLHNYGPPDPREASWDHARDWDADGVAVLGPSPEDFLLYLAAHLNLHAFGRLLWYYDLTAFVLRWRERIDWDLLGYRASTRQLTMSFYFSLKWMLQLIYPDTALPEELEALRPSRLATLWFERAWRKKEVFALRSYIRPFDASFYHLLSGSPMSHKIRYLWHILLPPTRWLATYLRRPRSLALNLDYLRQRRSQRRSWNDITRRSQLLPDEI